MPAGGHRPAVFLLAALLALAACETPSASPSPTIEPTPSPTARPSPSPSPSPSPTPRPTPTATPVPSGCTIGERVDVGQRQIIASVPSAGPAIALTFDMGGRLDPGLAILNFLIDNHVCATIFPTGAMSQTAAGQQILALIREHPELFELGNHTMHHCNLRDGGGGSPTSAPCLTGGPPTAEFITAELTDAAAILEAGTGLATIPYWRPPYGISSETVLATAAAANYTKTIMWSIDTIDWRPLSENGPTATQIATKVVTSATNGSIVLMHLGGYETLAALQIMVPALRERGVLLTSVSDLLT